ncbi:hypothetical protein D3C81_2070390 [compost metagenome]
MNGAGTPTFNSNRPSKRLKAISDNKVNARPMSSGMLWAIATVVCPGMQKLTSRVMEINRTRWTTITLPDARSDSSKSNTAASAPG